MAQNHTEDFKHFSSVVKHIANVQFACRSIAEGLWENEEADLARRLMHISLNHDASKFVGVEWHYLRKTSNKAERDLAQQQHVETNPHHPEYWGDIHNMPRVYLAEFVADTYARSSEFGTDYRDWMRNQAAKKFGFNTKSRVYKDIRYFMSFILEQPFKDK